MHWGDRKGSVTLNMHRIWRALWFAMVLAVVCWAFPVGPATAAGPSYSLGGAVRVFNRASDYASHLPVTQVLVELDPAMTGGVNTALLDVTAPDGSRLDILPLGVDGSSVDLASNVAGQVYLDYPSSYKTARLSFSAAAIGSVTRVALTLKVNARDADPGDLTLNITQAFGGLINARLVVATSVSSSVAATALSTPDVGANGTAVGIYVQENTAGGLKADAVDSVTFTLPDGFAWQSGDGSPGVEVLRGAYHTASQDVAVKTGDFQAVVDGRTLKLAFNPSGYQHTAQAISFNLRARITVADADAARAGDVAVTLGGRSAWIPETDLKVASYGGRQASPTAPDHTGGIAVFKIGQSDYTLNSTAVTMDGAPYIKDGRTYMPLRYAANALGVPDTGIAWDAASRTVTVTGGGHVVKFTVDSADMLSDGATVVMDAAPELVSGQVMVPIRFLGQALRTNFAWDQTAQTVTVTF